MKDRKIIWRVYLIGIISIAVVWMGFSRFHDVDRGYPYSDFEGSGPFPSPWFLQQRLWPDTEIAPADFLAARETARTLLLRGSLDEHPPWIEAGPVNVCGRITDLVWHPWNQQIIYVAAASGGIFRTNDDGQNWVPIFDQAPGLSMGALAIDPNYPDILYAGTGEANSAGYSYFGTGVYRTSNGGASWEHRGLTETRYISRIVLNPVNSQEIWVAAMGELFVTNSERGVYHSTNGGLSWRRALFVNDSTGASDVLLHPENPQIVYAALWQRIRTPEWRWVGGRGSGIYRSTDAGVQWERLSDGLPQPADNVGRIGLAISQSNPNVLYAIYADHPGNFAGVYRTNDGGDTWGRVNDGDLAGLFSNFGWYFGQIRVRPDNENVVFALGVGLVRSTNGGQSWHSIGNEVHVDHHAMWFFPSQPTRILLGNDGGVYRSTNSGNSWTYLDGIPSAQFYAITVDPQLPHRGYGGTQDNGTLRTLTGNLDDWETIYWGDGFYTLVDPANSNVIYAESQWGGLGRSDNGGQTWQTITNGIPVGERRNWSTPVAFSPSNSRVLYYGAERLYRTDNRGGIWNAISPDLTDGGGRGNITFGTITTIGVSRVNSAVIYAGTDDANVWATTNGGATWLNRSAGLPQRWITRVTPDPRVESKVYVSISGYRNAEQDAHLFVSDDFGATWRAISAGLPVGPLNDVIPDSLIRGRLYVASDFGVFVTPDDGEHWMVLGRDLPPVPVLDLELHTGSRQLIAGTYGRSMYRLDLNQLEMNRPPQIESFSPANLDTVDPGETYRFLISATDPDGDSIRYTWERDGDAIGWLPEVEIRFDNAGSTEMIVASASDGELRARQVWRVHVRNSQSAPKPSALGVLEWYVTAYPNPFNTVTRIELGVPHDGYTRVSIYDLTGRLQTELMNGNLRAGVHSLMWSPTVYGSGVYLIHVQQGRERKSHKVFLIR